jgi:nucleotide-binding universal stress UspA family protein
VTVLVCYLPTPEGEAAFRAGLAEATRRDEPLVVLNSPRAGAPMTTTLADEDTLARLREEAAGAGLTLDVRTDSHRDDLVPLVLELADELDASVLVLGLRRRSPVGKLLMGSAAQRLLIESERPVLTVKA